MNWRETLIFPPEMPISNEARDLIKRLTFYQYADKFIVPRSGLSMSTRCRIKNAIILDSFKMVNLVKNYLALCVMQDCALGNITYFVEHL